MSMEKRKKTRELSEEVRHKIVPNMDNLKATSPSPDTLMFLCPLYTMLSESLRSMALQPTSLDVATRENLIEDCSEGLFEWWRKHLNELPTRFKMICRYKVHQFQLTPSVVNSMKGVSMVGDPEGPHCWDRDIRKPDWSLPKNTWMSQNPSGRMSCEQMRSN